VGVARGIDMEKHSAGPGLPADSDGWQPRTYEQAIVVLAVWANVTDVKIIMKVTGTGERTAQRTVGQLDKWQYTKRDERMTPSGRSVKRTLVQRSSQRWEWLGQRAVRIVAREVRKARISQAIV